MKPIRTFLLLLLLLMMGHMGYGEELDKNQYLYLPLKCEEKPIAYIYDKKFGYCMWIYEGERVVLKEEEDELDRWIKDVFKHLDVIERLCEPR